MIPVPVLKKRKTLADVTVFTRSKYFLFPKFFFVFAIPWPSKGVEWPDLAVNKMRLAVSTTHGRKVLECVGWPGVRGAGHDGRHQLLQPRRSIDVQPPNLNGAGHCQNNLEREKNYFKASIA